VANNNLFPNVEVRTTADGSKTLYSGAYKQTFHSDKGALAEAQHVFIQGSALALRLRSQPRVRVLEVGFGTGLNFLLSAQVAGVYDTTLEYYALEKTLLPREVLEPLDYQQLLADSDVWQRFLAWQQHLNVSQVMTRSAYCFDWHNVTLKLLVGDARDRILDLGHVVHADVSDAARDYNGLVDVIYHDAFSFDANSELWSEAFLRHLYNVLVPGGVLATYSVKGVVRRRLAAGGFQVDKLPGPVGGKREMLVATKV
jgi:tRNA U34 5-methylaminomethyl-2-thiouridine-forming methyltransferase MnmC